MPALPKAQYGLQELHLFPYFQTREDYSAKMGHDAPAWNPDRPPKAWEDPKASASARRNVVYDFVVAYAESGAPLVTRTKNRCWMCWFLLKRRRPR